MQDKLVIFLHTYDAERPDWVVLNADNVFRYNVRHGNSADLTEAAADREITVIVPAEDVLITSVTLPKMNRTRLAQALPFALEEKLIGDVDALHFAQGDLLADGSLPVAVVSREKMQTWMALLQSWNIQADRMVPASLALPADEHAWNVAVNGMTNVRLGQYQGFGCDKNNLKDMLDIAWEAAEIKPERLHIFNYSTQALAGSLNLQTKIEEDFHAPDQLYVELAKTAVTTPSINLLQAEYRTKKSRYPKIQKIWKLTMYLAIAWVVLLFFYPTISYFILRHKLSGMESQIVAIYKRNFPLSSSIVAPRLRMEEKLRNVSSQAGDSKLFLMLGYIGKGMLEKPSIKIKRFDFKGNQLTLELLTPSSEDFAAFTDFLARQGVTIKQQNATMQGARIIGTVVME